MVIWVFEASEVINWTDFELNAIILNKKKEKEKEKEDFASSRSVPFGSDNYQLKTTWADISSNICCNHSSSRSKFALMKVFQASNTSCNI